MECSWMTLLNDTPYIVSELVATVLGSFQKKNKTKRKQKQTKKPLNPCSYL